MVYSFQIWDFLFFYFILARLHYLLYFFILIFTYVPGLAVTDYYFPVVPPVISAFPCPTVWLAPHNSSAGLCPASLTPPHPSSWPASRPTACLATGYTLLLNCEESPSPPLSLSLKRTLNNLPLSHSCAEISHALHLLSVKTNSISSEFQCIHEKTSDKIWTKLFHVPASEWWTSMAAKYINSLSCT